MRSPCYTRRNIAFFNFCIILSCNCRPTNCSAIIAAILNFIGEASLPISETVFPATGNIIGTKIVKITHIYRSQHMTISAVFIYLGSHLGLPSPDCKTNFKNGFAALDNP